MPRVIWVILICIIIVTLVNLLLPVPAPWGYVLYLALVVWVIVEALRAFGMSLPPRT